MPDVSANQRPVRVALLEVPGVLDSSLLAVLEQNGFQAVRDPRDPTADVIVLPEGHPVARQEAQRRLFASPSIPLIVVTRDGSLEIYDRRVLRRAAAADLALEIRHLAVVGNARNPMEGS